MQKVKRNLENNDDPSPAKKVRFEIPGKEGKSKKPIKSKNVNTKKQNGKIVQKKEIKASNKDKIKTNGKTEFNKKKTKSDFSGKNKGGYVKKTKDGKVFPKNTKDGNKEKPKWSEMKKEKKELRLTRRKAKATAPVFELSYKAKLLASQIQRKIVKPEFRNTSCQELHRMLKGQYKNIALTHDLSRVIQVLLKYSSEDIKSEIAEEILDIVVPMAQSKYAHHSVNRILKHGTEFIRHEVIKKFFGSVVSLATHSVSAPVLDFAYGEHATQKEKLFMQQEFYGDIYKNTKDEKVKCITDTYKDSPEMKAAVLSACKANIQKVLDKNLHDGELLHSILYDYIRECSGNDKTDLITTLSPLIVPLSNSLPGVNAACICVWQGTNKDKKTILKVVKEHAVSLSMHKTGYRLLLAIFDSVDDTVLVKKAIVSTLAGRVKDIAKDHWGKMTLHWLVKPNDKAAFHPNLIKFLKEGAKDGTSKKDAELRVSELREAILPALKSEIETNSEFWLLDPTIMLLTTTILSIESSKEIMLGIAKAICRPDWLIKKDDKELLAIEDAGMHMCLKKMAVLDKDKEDSTLGEAVSQCISGDTVKVWLATNRGCFFLLKLIENNNTNAASALIEKMKPETSFLKEQTTPGSKLLLKRVEE